jgi:hypothetical protein
VLWRDWLIRSKNPKLLGTSSTTAYKFTNQSFFFSLLHFNFVLLGVQADLSPPIVLHSQEVSYFMLTLDSFYMTHTTLCEPHFFINVSNRFFLAIVNPHPPPHHPLDAYYYLVVDERQLSYYLVSPW